jgi:hypothetical protein
MTMPLAPNCQYCWPLCTNRRCCAPTPPLVISSGRREHVRVSCLDDAQQLTQTHNNRQQRNGELRVILFK